MKSTQTLGHVTVPHVSSSMPKKTQGALKISQQTVVFALFVLIFIGFAIGLPGFFRVDNLLTLVRSVSVLGILGLGMALIVIGRGIDLSMVATLVVALGLLLQMVQDGHPLWLAGRRCSFGTGACHRLVQWVARRLR